mgnify:FL=1
MPTYREDFIIETISLYKKQLTLIREFKLSKNNEEISHQHIVPFSTYSPWLDDNEFIEIYNKIKNNTIVDIYRCFELWNFIKRNKHLKGDIIEVGVWRGGTGCVMAKSAQLFSPCKTYLADTFKGVVKAGEKDTIYKGGEHSDTSIAIVTELLKELDIPNTELLVGIFPNQVSIPESKTGSLIKLCHIDVDTYESAKEIFVNIWPNITKGGAVIFDDYGFWGYEGITTLCNEISVNDGVFIHNLNGHGIFIKS